MDIQVEDHGSIALLRPLTDAGETWLQNNCHSEPWQWWAGALAVEPRYLEAIAIGIAEDGLALR
jgi:hypothetical protein